MKTIRKALVTSALVILGGLSVGGCATTGYVDEKIAAVNARIDGLEARVQQNAANRVSHGCPTGLAQRYDRNPSRTQPAGEKAQLRRLSRSLRAFEHNQLAPLHRRISSASTTRANAGPAASPRAKR